MKIKISDILNMKCSVYPNAWIAKKYDITIRQFLYNIAENPKNKANIEFLRNIESEDEQRKFKQKYLIQGFLCCVCGNDRTEENIVHKNNLYIIDIDFKENLFLADLNKRQEIKHQIFNLPYVAFINDSCRGKGFFVGVPVMFTDKKRYREHINALREDFKEMFNIEIDYYDSFAHGRFSTINNNLMIKSDDTEIEYYDKLLEDKQETSDFDISDFDISDLHRNRIINSFVYDELFVYNVIKNLIKTGNYSADDYNSWYKDACRLSTMPVIGEELFSLLSISSSNYTNEEDVRRKFNEASKAKHGFTLQRSVLYYFKIAKDTWGDDWVIINKN